MSAGEEKKRKRMVPAVLKLLPAVQNYEWGVKGGGDTSLVARMARSEPADEPFAELWMGTHVKAPSKVVLEGEGGKKEELLTDFLVENADFHGEKTASTFGHQLPFLFKCLSVAKALSIQAHPDKSLAAKLHVNDKKNYPDDNHKPELACAVTEFQGLCGFRPLSELKAHVQQVPELRGLIGEGASAGLEAAEAEGEDARKAALKTAYEKLMDNGQEAVEAAAKTLIARLEAKDSAERTTAEDLVLRVNKDFRHDIGLFSIFLLNYVTLQPGQALFLGPNLPHAYLLGDCMEIMATSDNVVRAGFTPKFKDVSTLTGMLTYECGPADVLDGVEEHGGAVRLYAPPSSDFPEFSLRRVTLSPSLSVTLGSSVSPRVVICVSGKATLEATPSGAASSTLTEAKLALSSGIIAVSAAKCDLTLTGGDDGTALMFVASCHPTFEA